MAETYVVPSAPPVNSADASNVRSWTLPPTDQRGLAQGAANVIDVGKLLSAAKEELTRDAFTAMVKSELDFDFQRRAQVDLHRFQSDALFPGECQRRVHRPRAAALRREARGDYLRRGYDELRRAEPAEGASRLAGTEDCQRRNARRDHPRRWRRAHFGCRDRGRELTRNKPDSAGRFRSAGASSPFR